MIPNPDGYALLKAFERGHITRQQLDEAVAGIVSVVCAYRRDESRYGCRLVGTLLGCLQWMCGELAGQLLETEPVFS